MKKLPLHFQILIALILGTIVGVFANPGDFTLEDTQRDVEIDGTTKTVDVTERRIHFADDGKSITVTYTRKENGGSVVDTEKFANADEMADAQPSWQAIYADYAAGIGRNLTVSAKWVGDMFLRLLKMVTIPLIMTSLVSGVAGLGSTSRFGSMFGKTLLYYFVTSMLAITVGIVMVNIVSPGVGATLPGGGEGAISGADNTLAGVFISLAESMVPTNPIHALAEGQFLSIIAFSILLGVFIIFAGGETGQRMRQFFEDAFAVMLQMTMFIIRLAPIGVFAFMLFATSSQGLDIFKTLGWYMLAVFLALAVHATIVLPLILKFVAKQSPLAFFKAMSPALMTAVSTASSNGTLPLTLTCVEQRAGVSNRISSFVLPLGATINMDGTALYEAVAVLFIAQAEATVNPDFTLTLGTQVVVAITALMASVGAAGIPHAGLVMMAIVLQAVGLPLEAQGVIIAVDRILDMFRTSVNVWSDSCGCAVLARFEKNSA